jgi:hypothetical protein
MISSRLSIGLLSLVAAIFPCNAGRLFAGGGPFILSPGQGEVYVDGGWGRTGNYYDTEGNLKLFDSVQTSFSLVTLSLRANYGLNGGLELNLNVPVGYYQLTSKKLFPDRSIFQPVYVGIGATYELTHEVVSTTLGSMLKIPPGFHRGIYDDPAHPSFLSDGYLQWTTTLSGGMKLKENWIKAGIAYNWRDEEPLDEILYTAELGFSRVEGAGAFVGVNGVVSTGDVRHPARPFYAGASGDSEEVVRRSGGSGRFSTIDRESYLAIHAGANVDITDHISLEGRYDIRLFGINSLSLQGGYFGIGYRF